MLYDSRSQSLHNNFTVATVPPTARDELIQYIYHLDLSAPKADRAAQGVTINMAQQLTNYMEIQRDEIEALRSIYMEDFEEEEIKTGAWNVGDSISNF